MKEFIRNKTKIAVNNDLIIESETLNDLKKIIEAINENELVKTEIVVTGKEDQAIFEIKNKRIEKKKEDFLGLLNDKYEEVNLEKDIAVGTPLYAYQYFELDDMGNRDKTLRPVSVKEYEPRYELDSMKHLGNFEEFNSDNAEIHLKDPKKKITVEKKEMDTLSGQVITRKIKIYKKKTDVQQGGRRRSKKSRNRKSKKKSKKKGRKTKRRS